MFSIALSALVEDPMFKLEWPSDSKNSLLNPVFTRGISKEGGFPERWVFGRDGDGNL